MNILMGLKFEPRQKQFSEIYYSTPSRYKLSPYFLIIREVYFNETGRYKITGGSMRLGLLSYKHVTMVKRVTKLVYVVCKL